MVNDNAGQMLLEGRLDGVGWVPRHFRLSAHELEYYAPNELQNPSGIITIHNIIDVTTMTSTGNGREIAIRAPGRNYLLRAPSQSDAEDWKMAILKAVHDTKASDEANEDQISKMGTFGALTRKHTGIGRDTAAAPEANNNAPFSTTFESLEVDPGKKDYIDRNQLKNHLSHVLMACADSKPRDPLQWMSEYLKKLSSEEEENISEEDQETVRYKESWRWYIYAAERKIDFWKDMLPPDTGHPEQIPREDLSKFTCFLPQIILKAIDKGKIKRNVEVITTGASRPLNPIVSQGDGVIVFTDASGFTSLTEKLSKQPNGAEELGRFLNVFFGKLINIVNFFGGDIIKFSGDAVTVMWPASQGVPDADPHVAIYRACQCCNHIHKALTDYETPVEGVKFSFHIGIGYGLITVMQVGGIFDRWEYCIAGTPLEQISVAEPLAKSGETCLSPQAAQLLLGACQTLNISYGKLQKTEVPNYVLLGTLQEINDLTKRTMEKQFAGEKFEASMLKKYIPASMYRSLKEGAHFEEEMRRVTVVFLSIGGLDTSKEEGATMAQLLMTCCQRSVYALEGSVNKFLVDDKGVLLLAVFGLPPLSHFGDDPVRATLAGMRMLDSLKAEDVAGRVGVATGTVWCGVVGNDYRKEYTVLGDVVNLSARLMGNAKSGGIFVDENTYQVLIKHDFEVEKMTPVVMKGKAHPVPVFCPTGRVYHKRVNNLFRNTKTKNGKQHLASFWTTSKEVEKMRKVILQQLFDGGGVGVISGPAGSGKSQLLNILRMLQQTEKFSLLQGDNMSPTDTHSVPFLCWQRIFTSLGEHIRNDPELVAELTGGSSSSTGGVSMKSLISSMLSYEMENWVPLLSKVMTNLEFGDTLVKAMTDADLRHQKKNQLRSICMEVLEWYSSRRPTVILLHLKQHSAFKEDPDKRVYPFARGVADLIIKRKKKLLTNPIEEVVDPKTKGPSRKPCLIFILCCRENSREMLNPTFTWLKDVARESGSLIETRRFTKNETGKYLGFCYGHTNEKTLFLPPQMINYVHDVTQGNASLIDKIAEQFLEEAIVQIGSNGDIRWEPADGAELEERLNALEPTESIVGIAFSQFDRLRPSQQHVIKIATALHQDQSDDTFTMDQLCRAMGKMEPQSIKEIEEELDQLVVDEIFLCMNNEARVYRFVSKFWKIAAARLTLQGQKWKVQR